MRATEERDRITTRVSHPIAMKLQEAADLSGATLNQFVIQSALEKAEKIIDREKALYFSENDAAMLINMLDNPSKPNAALMRALERYKVRENNGNLGNSTELNP